MKQKKVLIKVPHGGVGKIANALSCSKGLVSLVLGGRDVASETAKKIRHVALTQYDGVEMKPVEKEKQSEEVK